MTYDVMHMMYCVVIENPHMFIDTICDYSYIATTCVINHLLNIFQWVLVVNREAILTYSQKCWPGRF